MRTAIVLATAFLVAACAGPSGPVLVEVRSDGAAAPVVAESVPAASRATATEPAL
jgi:hypothetical protein